MEPVKVMVSDAAGLLLATSATNVLVPDARDVNVALAVIDCVTFATLEVFSSSTSKPLRTPSE